MLDCLMLDLLWQGYGVSKIMDGPGSWRAFRLRVSSCSGGLTFGLVKMYEMDKMFGSGQCVPATIAARHCGF